jgi:hypothetical protein
VRDTVAVDKVLVMNKQETIDAVLDVVDDYVYELPHDFDAAVALKASRVAKYGYFNGREVLCKSNNFKIVIRQVKGHQIDEHYVLETRVNGNAKDLYPMVFESAIEASEVAEEIASVQNIAVELMDL